MNTVRIATRILRYTWVLLFAWFGVKQLIEPSMWIGYLPEWLGYLPVPAEMFVQLNGWSELVMALLLALGIWQRPVLLLLSLHLFGIALQAGGAVGVRDAALGMIGVALLVLPLDTFPWKQDRAETPSE